jgi:amino acid adenylation domain-containing protein
MTSDNDDVIQRLRNLSPEQRQLIERTLASRNAATQRPIPRRSAGGPSPLSFGQRRMWFLNRLQPDLTNYNKPVAIRLTGPLDRVALQRSFDEVVRRHETLRTTYEVTPDGPEQRIHPTWSFPLTTHDLTHLPDAERAAECRRLIETEARTPFDLSRQISLRAMLIGRGSDDHVLVTTLHHIAMDAWSRNLLWKELSLIYEAYSQGQPSPLPELAIQYADFAAWQLERMAGPQMTRQLGYWTNRLAHLPPVIDLPADRPRPPIPTGRGGRLRFELPERLKPSLLQLARGERATLFMVTLAAFQTLLHRYTGLDDIAVGTPTSGRPRVETEALIGYLVNTVVMRCDLSNDPTFRQLLGQVRQVASEAIEHQGFPYDRLIEVLAPERRLSHQPIVQVMFSLKNTPTHKLDLAGTRSEAVLVEHASAKFDLWFELVEMPHGLRGKIEFNADLFDLTTIERMLGHYRTLLDAVIAEPDRPISQVPLMSDDERQQLARWSGAPAPPAGCKALHELFERQVLRTPDAIAIDGAGKQQTYGDVNARANRLAHELQTLGVGPDVLVAIALDRSPELIIGLLGILKAGGAYLPLDLSYPRDRLQFMLQDSAAPVLITQQRLLSQLPTEGMRVICLDEDPTIPPGLSSANPGVDVSSQHLAYVLYTSGSTGRPKGVMIEHRSAVTFIEWACRTFSPDDMAGLLASTSVCFDLSVFEIFAPLCCGGTVILADNALALPSLSASGNVTLLNTVPSAIAELIHQDAIPDTIQTIALAGEFLPQHLVREIYAKTHARRVFDLYGPTEATVYATGALRTAGGVPTIGRPIAGNRVVILDTHRQLVPVGIPGELHIGGAGLARGYWNRPELTAEKFIADPFGPPGSRLYKTGDLARFLTDGTIEYLGRMDHQVKLRGFRIELGEIEAVLRQHADVREAVVIAREDRSGDKRLVAYVVGQPGIRIEESSLRDAATKALPGYMVPSAFVMLEQLPLTPNGKLDRRALPIPNARDTEVALVAPRDLLERQLIEIWEQVLKVQPIGIHDDFFKLGGHSLLAVRLFDRLAKATGHEIPLATLFECPTVAHLSAALRDRNWSPRWKSLTAIQTGGSKQNLFLIPPAGGSVLRFAQLAKELGSDQPVYGLEPLGHDGRDTPHESVDAMAAAYLSEIEQVQPAGPYVLAGICFGGCIALEMAQQLRRKGQSTSHLILLDSAAPAHGPTWTSVPLHAEAQTGMAEQWASAAYAEMLEEGVRLRMRHLRRLGIGGGPTLRRMIAAHLKAQLTYTGSSYDGRVLFLQSEENSALDNVRSLWSQLAPDLKVIVLPGTAHRDLLLGTESTPLLARIIGDHLNGSA